MNKKFKQYFPFYFASFVIFFLALSANAQQQNAQVLLTWHANNFYPSDFKGKPFVTRNTVIELAAEVLKNNTFVDTSNATFYWYIDEKLIQKGAGLKEISYTTSKVAGDNHFARVVIKNGKETHESAKRIPIQNYELSLEIPFFGNIVSPDTQANLRVIPYFFNISALDELGFSWKINNETQQDVTGNELTLNIGTSNTSNESLRIETKAYNIKNPLEFTVTRGELFIQ